MDSNPDYEARSDEKRGLLYAGLSLGDVAVCLQHLRFLPCRVCMYDTIATTPYSDRPEDVEIVRLHQTQSDG